MIRSPVVYSGSKFSLMKQLLSLFPKNIDTFYDVFCGSCTVSLNVDANHYKCNDICKPLIDLYNWRNHETEKFRTEVRTRIQQTSGVRRPQKEVQEHQRSKA